MPNFSEIFSKYDWLNAGVYQIEKGDTVEGGPDGTSNRQALELTHRTRDLNNRLEVLGSKVEGLKGGDLGTGYDTLLKLQNKLRTVETAINGDNGNALIETLQEALAFINKHKADIDSLVATYVKKSSIADNLTTSDNRYVLAANRGKELKDLYDTMATAVQGKETPAGAQLKAYAAMLSAHAYTDRRIYYDYIVDSDEALEGLSNNPSAERVLVKAGTWTANTQINIDGNCRLIYGEPGSKIVVNTNAPGSENTPVSALYGNSVAKLVNVTAQIAGSANGVYLVVFNGFDGMENCEAITEQAFMGNMPDVTAGFYNCLNLTGCRAQCAVTSLNNLSPKYEYGFWQCRNLTQCSATVWGKATVSGLENEIYAHGFYKCDFLTNCNATVNGGEANLFHGMCFYSCDFLNNCNGLADGSGTGLRISFNSCHFLNNCSGTVTGVQDFYLDFPFYECESVTFCRGTASGSGMYAFKNCNYVSYCVASGMGFGETYAGAKDGSAAANTAAGGYNRIG